MSNSIIFNKILIPPVILLLCIISVILIWQFLSDYNFIIFPYNLVGIPTAFFGFTIMGKARELLKKHSIARGFTSPHRIINEGIFAKSRNPMYLGMTILLFGFTIFFNNVIGFLLPVLFLIVINKIFIPMEEKILLESFGEEYTNYKNSINKWI